MGVMAVGSPLWNSDVLRLFLQTRLYSEVQPILHLVLSRMVLFIIRSDA